MPLPKPNKGEQQDAFISRCMSNPQAMKDFPQSKQRLGVCFSQFRRKDKAMEDFGEKLGVHDVIENEDGTFDVLRVPIFDADGSHKSNQGRLYDEAWAKDALATHDKLRQGQGYLPAIGIGHAKDGQETEPASFGHIDKLKLIGKTVYADLVRLGKEFYGQLKEGKWPSRSIISTNTPNDKRILGLDVLGTTTPACKFTPIHLAAFYGVEPENIDAFEYTDIVEKFDEHNNLTHRTLVGLIQDAAQLHFMTPDVVTGRPKPVFVRDTLVKTQTAIIEVDGVIFSVEYTINESNDVAVTAPVRVSEEFEPMEEAVKPEKQEDNMTAEEKAAEDLKLVEAEKAAEKLEADKKSEALKKEQEEKDKMKDNINKQEMDKMASERDQMAERVKTLEDKATESEKLADIARVESFIERRNASGNLPKALIFPDGEDKDGLREMLLATPKDQREEWQKYIEAIPTVVQFKESALVEGEENSGAITDNQKGEKFAEATKVYMKDNEDVSLKDAQIVIAKEHPDWVVL